MAREFPFPIPNGWFQVAYSDELGCGDVEPLRYFGKELVLARTEDGVARVFDAYCPHLGAHLGFGGVVEGDTIRCPFHAWRFDGSGRCVEVPYARRIPPRAGIHAWPTCERNGCVMVWHDRGGEKPGWEIPEVPELCDAGWTEPTRREWTVRSCTQELAENTVDQAHFRYLHGTNTVAETELETQDHVLHVVSRSKVATPKGEADGVIDIRTHGFGFGTTRFSGVVETLVVTTGTPIDADHVHSRPGADHVHLRLRFSIRKLANADATRGVGKAFVAEIERQFAQDIPIWENKAHLVRPMLCDGDGPIAELRKWAKQFYGPEAGAETRP